jgi:hypothetical protein
MGELAAIFVRPRSATHLHVSQRTLVEWNRQLAPDIRALRAMHLEELLYRVGPALIKEFRRQRQESRHPRPKS